MLSLTFLQKLDRIRKAIKKMSSIINDRKTKTKRFMFYGTGKKRHTIRLGNVTMEIARSFKARVDVLINAQKMQVAVDPGTARWVRELPDKLHADLAKYGLVIPRKQGVTLGDIIPKLIKSRAATVSEQTIEIWEQSKKSLYRYFGQDKRVDTITRTDAESFRSWLVSDGRLDGKGGLKPTTVWKRLQHVMAFFKLMVLNDDIVKNPFEGMSMSPVVDEERNEYIDEEFIYKIMEYVPDAEWRLLISLWRFGGFRGSTEPLLLRWQDIQWDDGGNIGTITVTSKKTKRYAGQGTRIIPIFPELVKPLYEAFEQSKEGDVYVITKHAPHYLRKIKNRGKLDKIKANLGTVFAKYVRKAGIQPWPKIVNNLRASFETDLLNGKYDTPDRRIGIQTIAKWLGHSPKVMLKHYGRVSNEDFKQIAQFTKQANQEEAQKQDNIHADTENTGIKGCFQAAQKAAQYTTVRGGKALQETF